MQDTPNEINELPLKSELADLSIIFDVGMASHRSPVLTLLDDFAASMYPTGYSS